MNRNNGRKEGVDRLLRETLRDDLPVEVERRMKARSDRCRKEIEDEHPEKSASRTFRPNSIRLPVFRWLPQSGLAAAGIFLIILGGLLQEGGSSHVLAKNISLIRTWVLVKDQVALSESMTCRIERIQEGEKKAGYVIKWLPPDHTRIDLIDARGKTVRTIWMIQGDFTVIDHATGEVASAVDLERVADPYLSAAAGFIHPARLAERLYEEWLETTREIRGDCEQRTYRLHPPGNAEEAVEMTVNMCDWLPVSVSLAVPSDPSGAHRAAELLLRFEWNTPVSPEEMLPAVLHRRSNG